MPLLNAVEGLALAIGISKMNPSGGKLKKSKESLRNSTKGIVLEGRNHK